MERHQEGALQNLRRPIALEPFYFQSSGRPLFGCFHPPRPGTARESAVVLCHPLGEEYIRFHRALRRLADLLAGAGFPVLRFDFYACGDSAGESHQGQFSHWLVDVATAIDQVRRRAGVARVCLVGLRLGGTLSALVGAGRGDVDAMVLWDPIVSGRHYLHELAVSHREMLQRAHVKPVSGPPDAEDPAERLGFPLALSLQRDLEALDLLALRGKPAGNLLLVESDARSAQGSLAAHLTALGARLHHECLSSPGLWVWEEAVGRVLVPHQVLQLLVSWISEVCP
jgi:pimeloyl-ACP methyl ester carboxylesterase